MILSLFYALYFCPQLFATFLLSSLRSSAFLCLSAVSSLRSLRSFAAKCSFYAPLRFNFENSNLKSEIPLVPRRHPSHFPILNLFAVHFFATSVFLCLRLCFFAFFAFFRACLSSV